MSFKEWLRRCDWILLFYLIGFTGGLVITMKHDYELVENILSVFGLIACYLLIFLLSGVETKKKKKGIPPYID